MVQFENEDGGGAVREEECGYGEKRRRMEEA